jgi:ribonuclease J
LLPLKKNIAGILITNGHLDHIGGLRYILPALDFPPIYGMKLAMGFVRKQMEEAGLRDKVELHIIEPEVTPSFTVGKHFQVTLFRENYTIPDACGICIQTPHARIVHTGDFKFDFTPSLRPADLISISKIGDK